MQDFLNVFSPFFSANIDTLGLTLATALATGLVFALKTLFAFAGKLAGKTPSSADDKIVEETREAFKQKSQDL